MSVSNPKYRNKNEREVFMCVFSYFHSYISLVSICISNDSGRLVGFKRMALTPLTIPARWDCVNGSTPKVGLCQRVNARRDALRTMCRLTLHDMCHSRPAMGCADLGFARF